MNTKTPEAVLNERWAQEFVGLASNRGIDYLLLVVPATVKRNALMCRDFSSRAQSKRTVQQIATQYRIPNRQGVYAICKSYYQQFER